MALQNAYVSAVEQGAGIRITSMARMENFEKAAHVLLRRTEGYIRSFTMIHDGPSMEEPSKYEVIIDAKVLTGSAHGNADLMALGALLGMVDHPKVLLFMGVHREPDSSSSATSLSETVRIQEHGEDSVSIDRSVTLGGLAGESNSNTESSDLETVMASELSRLGYQVLTTLDVHDGEKDTSKKISQARAGYTKLARELGRNNGADIVILGSLRYEINPLDMVIYGVRYKYSVRATTSAKAVLASTGEVLDVSINEITRRARTPREARHGALTDTARQIARQLGWKIPEVLAQYPQIISVSILNCPSTEVTNLALTLRSVPGVQAVTGGEWERFGGDLGKTQFTVHTRYGQLTSGELSDDLQVLNPGYHLSCVGRYQINMTRKEIDDE